MKRDGYFPVNAFFISVQTRSGISSFNSPDLEIIFSNSIVSSAILKPKQAAKRATRNTRRGSSTNAEETWRKIPFFKSVLPSYGSIKFPFSSSAIAFMVMSLRFKSSSSIISGEE